MEIGDSSFGMSAGDGRNSYFHNSQYQILTQKLMHGTTAAQAKVLLTRSIRQYLELPSDPDFAPASNRVLRVADLGCAVGPNTFASVQTITEAVISEYEAKGLGSVIPEFQVFFNDQVGNDFNTLFRNLPSGRPYTVAAVPGSFYGRLFPTASIDVFHQAFALHWLAKVPDEVKSPESPAWNKGRVGYAESAPEVAEAYRAQFTRDARAFFEARYVEMTENGLIAVLMPCRAGGSAPSRSIHMEVTEFLGHALQDMANEGLVEESLLDSFNFAIFMPTPSEVTEAVLQVKGLSVEVVEVIYSSPKLSTHEDITVYASHLRALFDDILSQHFGSATTNMLFERFPEKLAEYSKKSSASATRSTEKYEHLFALIKKIGK